MMLLLEICTPPPPPPAKVAGVQSPLHFVSRLLVASYQPKITKRAFDHCIGRMSMMLFLDMCQPPPPPPAEMAGVQRPLRFVSRLCVALYQEESIKRASDHYICSMSMMLLLEMCKPPPPPPAEAAGVYISLHFVLDLGRFLSTRTDQICHRSRSL